MAYSSSGFHYCMYELIAHVVYVTTGLVNPLFICGVKSVHWCYFSTYRAPPIFTSTGAASHAVTVGACHLVSRHAHGASALELL